jgi:Tol biopolymer transport system component
LSLHKLDLGNGNDGQLTKNVGKSYQPRVSPDSNQVVYYSDRRSDFDIWLLDLRTNFERPIASHPATDMAPDWSPDGREIVFVSNRDGPFRLWKADVERGNARRLLEQPVIAPASIGMGGAQRPGPRWSPDGRKIGFLAAKDGHVFICSMDLKSGSVRWLVPDVMGFDWYRDSRRLVYSRAAPAGSDAPEMRIRDLETDHDTLLYRGTHLDPAISPDGSGILFTDGRTHFKQNLFLLGLAPAAGPERWPRPIGNPKQLTDGHGDWHVHQSAWFPDGRAVAYDRHIVQGDIYLIQNYR